VILESSSLVGSATEHKPMKVKIIRGVMVAGVLKSPGSTIEVAKNVGELLISSNKAELVVEAAPKKAAPAAKKVAAATPKVATSKDKPSTPPKEAA